MICQQSRNSLLPPSPSNGECQKDLKRHFFNRLIALRKAGKISKAMLNVMLSVVGTYSKSTWEEILEVRDFVDGTP